MTIILPTIQIFDSEIQSQVTLINQVSEDRSCHNFLHLHFSVNNTYEKLSYSKTFELVSKLKWPAKQLLSTMSLTPHSLSMKPRN